MHPVGDQIDGITLPAECIPKLRSERRIVLDQTCQLPVSHEKPLGWDDFRNPAVVVLRGVYTV